MRQSRARLDALQEEVARRERELAQRETDLAQREADAELARKQAEVEAARREAEAELQRRQSEAELVRREAEIELARKEAELELLRRQAEVEAERRKADAELERRRREATTVRSSGPARSEERETYEYGRSRRYGRTESTTRDAAETLADAANRTADEIARVSGAFAAASVTQLWAAIDLVNSMVDAFVPRTQPWVSPRSRRRERDDDRSWGRRSLRDDDDRPWGERTADVTRDASAAVADVINRTLDYEERVIDRFYDSFKSRR
jgi:hypothetical protein